MHHRYAGELGRNAITGKVKVSRIHRFNSRDDRDRWVKLEPHARKALNARDSQVLQAIRYFDLGFPWPIKV